LFLSERLKIIDPNKLKEYGVYQNTSSRQKMSHDTYNDDDKMESLEKLPRVTHNDAAIIIDGCVEGKRYNAMRNAADNPIDLHEIALPLACEEVAE